MEVVVLQLASGPVPEENLAVVLREIGAASGSADLVVLPEATQAAFGDRPDRLAKGAEALDGPFVAALGEASSGGPTIIAGMFERSDDPERPFNTTVVVSGGSLVGAYRKIHLYDALGFVESEGVMEGPITDANLIVVDVAGVGVGVLTCFDIRFPEMAAALVARGAQVLALGAAWVPGLRKVEQWDTLLAARAIETTSFVVAAAQPAPRYCGHSTIVGPTGEVLARAQDAEEVVSARLDVSSLPSMRAAMPVISSRRLYEP
jgi:predicted amidohydrolase